MNLRARFLGLALLSVPLFFSCGEEENTIGLPPENDLGIFFVDIPLRDYTAQVWVDNISSRRRDAILAGSYTDEHFGLIQAQHFSEVLLPELNPGKRFQTDARFDSLVLEMRMNGLVGNQLAANQQTLEVYQLADTIVAFEKDYFNNSSQAVALKLGEKSFFVYPDSLGLNFDDTNLPDTSAQRPLYDANGEYIYMTRIRLDDAFGDQFFQDMKSDTTSSSDFSSSNAFSAYFKGLNIKGTPANSAIMRYSPIDSRSRMVLYYSQVEDDTLRPKSVSFTFSRSINYNNIAPNADQGWMGSDFDQINTFFEQVELDTGYAYGQSGTNMFISLDLSAFEQFADTVDNPIIQNAVMVFEDVSGDQDDANTKYELPRYLSYFITTKDSLNAGFYNVIPEVFSELPRTGIQYNEDIDGFRFEIPLYLQSLVRRRNSFNQLIISLSDVDPVTGQITPENRSFKRLIMDKDKMRIRLYYTIPDANTE